MKEVLPAVGKFLLQNTKFALGLAILENAHDVPAELVPLEPETLLDVEPKLLEKARGLMGRLPFDQIDVLIVGELGKNYSGAGMDPNVIGRLMVETQGDFEKPLVTRLAVLDVSDESHGNIVGVGFADLTTERLVSRMDPEPFRINVLTSCFLERARIPITLPTDRDVIEQAIETCWRIDASQARMVVIPNTLELETLWVTPALEQEVRTHPHLKRETEYRPMPLLPDGTLDQAALFPDCVGARRRQDAVSSDAARLRNAHGSFWIRSSLGADGTPLRTRGISTSMRSGAGLPSIRSSATWRALRAKFCMLQSAMISVPALTWGLDRSSQAAKPPATTSGFPFFFRSERARWTPPRLESSSPRIMVTPGWASRCFETSSAASFVSPSKAMTS